MIGTIGMLLSNILSTNISYDNTLIITWLVAGFTLLLLELSSPGLFLFLSFAAGCFCAALTAWLSYDLTLQWIMFFIGLIASFVLLKTLAKKNPRSHSIKTNTDGLIGLVALVTEPITEYQAGRIKVRGEEWPALSDKPHTTIEKNQHVTITAIRGNKVLVQPRKDHS